MSRARFQIQFIILALLLVGLFMAQSARVNVQARVEITPTITPDVANWNYMPIVRALGQQATPTPTSTVSPTDTPAPGRLAAPTLYDILNGDQDGTFSVGWSTVPGAEFYRLEQQRDSGTWQQVYEGPALSLNRSGLAEGQYCYRVRALNPTADGEWSAVKCASVVSATNTPTPTLTPTPGSLPAPVIKNIDNADGDGNFVVEWSTVTGVDAYRLREGVDGAEDAVIYAGSEPRLVRSNLPNGTYCYRVRAIIEGGEWGPYSETKCTTVTKRGPQFECTFETLYDGPRTNFSAMTMLQSGEVFIAGGADVNYVDQTKAYIFDPDTRDFRFVGDTHYAGHEEAVTLGDGEVLLAFTPWTRNGQGQLIENPMEVFDPTTGTFSEKESSGMCGDTESYYRAATGITMDSRQIVGICPNETQYEPLSVYVYDVLTDKVELWFKKDALCLDTYQVCFTANPAAVLSGSRAISNGAVAYEYFGTSSDPWAPTEVEITNVDNLRVWPFAAISRSWDGKRIYVSGGDWVVGDGEYSHFSRRALVLDTETYDLTKLPSFNLARTDHNLVALPNGNMVILGGRAPAVPVYSEYSDFTDRTRYDEIVLLDSVELFDVSTGRFYDAGSLNVARSGAKAITLLSGEILVYGGRANPGPGYSTIAPPEIGSCKKIEQLSAFSNRLSPFVMSYPRTICVACQAGGGSF